LSNSQGFATFEYLNTPDAILRWNAVRQQVRRQFSYIEQDLGVANLVAWWDLFTNDYFDLVGQRAQQWASEAIETAAAPFVQAHDAGRNLQTYEQVLGALEEMVQQITGMNLPPDTSMQNPQPPGGDGGGS
jgi:chitinase